MDLGRLSETEMEVMEVVWKLPAPVTVAQLLDAFKSKDWKTPTVSTILKRLIEKGFLTKSLSGKVNLYYPALTWRDYKRHETRKVLGRLYNGSIKNLIASLVDHEDLSREDIAELREWFARQEGEK